MTNQDVIIDTQGKRSPGLVFGATTGSDQYGSAINGSSMTVTVDQATISTQDDDSAGLVINGFGDGVTDSDMLTFVNDADITTSGDRSIGILLNTRSENAQDIITDTVVTNSQVRTSGQQSHGVVVDTGDGTNSSTNSSFTTFLGSLDIETTGDGANGLVLGPGLGVGNGSVVKTLTITSTVRASTTGDNADALVISENTLLALSSVGNPDSSIDNFDNFVATGAGSRSVQNFGTIDGGATGIVLTPGIGLRGNIANAGTILSSGTNAVTYDVAANSDDIFELQPGGVVNGNVLAGNGNDTFILGGTGIDTFDYTELGPKYQDFEAFVKEDSSRWILTGPDSSAPILPGTITGGTLVVNPNLSGFDLVIDPMGRLEGSGGVGNLTSSGAFSPGGLNQAADFGIAGNLLLQPGSLTQIDIFANGTSDMITVNGTATLGGQLFVNGVMYPTGFPIKREYIVLTSPGDVLGTFDSITDNLPDVNAMVTYLPSTGPLDPDDPNRPGTVIVSYERAGDESDKSIFSNSVQASGWMGRMFNETMQRRARLMTCGSALGYSGWTSGMGGFQGTKASAGASNYDAGFGGFAAGVDRVFSESGMMMRTGIAGGYLGGGLVSGPSTADLDTG